MSKHSRFYFPHKGNHIVKEINTSAERRKFYCTLGIYEGKMIEVIFREGERAVIRCDKNKIALAGKALREIKFNQIENI